MRAFVAIDGVLLLLIFFVSFACVKRFREHFSSLENRLRHHCTKSSCIYGYYIGLHFFIVIAGGGAAVVVVAAIIALVKREHMK